LSPKAWRPRVKKPEEVMEILEAYDLAGSLRGAAQLAGCDHKTVAHWVAQRDLGLVPKVERKRPGDGDGLSAQGRRARRTLERADSGGHRARQARRARLPRITEDHSPVGR
jgi:molybdenum-dependent DNA-binding transcriptional regulator ModE